MAFAEWATGRHDTAQKHLICALQEAPVAVNDADNVLIKHLNEQLSR
jgi:hypothetical protein